MDLKALERHCNAAAELIISDVVTSAADILADPDPGVAARDALAALVDACTLRRIANDARTVRKES
jgi:hypothetical protein